MPERTKQMRERKGSLRYHSAMTAAATKTSTCSAPAVAAKAGLMLLWVVVLTACQPATSVREAPTSLSPQLQTQLDQASAALRSDQPLAAAEQYGQLAQTDPERRSRWQLRQADALYTGGEYQRSSSVLELIDGSTLAPDELALLHLLQTENAIASMDVTGLQQAAATFRRSQPQLAAPYLPRAEAVRSLLQHAIDSRAQLALAVLQQSWPDALLRETAFATLAESTFMQLAQEYDRSDDVARGWLAAAADARQLSVAQHFELHWQASTPQQLLQAARSDEQQAFADLYVQTQSFPQRIAVILPQSGNLQSAAEAIRMGIISAWSMLPESSRPELYFIAADQGMIGAYYEALEWRSDLLLGPLAAEQVSAMRDLPDRIIPMLALNLPAEMSASPQVSTDTGDGADDSTTTADTGMSRSAGAAPPALASSQYFALPPEDSASAAAVWMRQLGHRNVVVLAADDNIGQRQLQAFSQALQQRDGSVLRELLFDPATIEFTSLLNTVLGLQNSLQRHQQLQELLGLELGFQARADDNIDALFVAADRRQARLLVPQLKFVDADYLPVFVTERSYAASRDSSNDRDLEAVHITLPGWQLGAPPLPALQQVQQWYPPARNEIVARLFGLGRDSLLLSAHRQRLQGDSAVRLQAASGELYIDQTGIVRRDLQRARYRNGVITPVE